VETGVRTIPALVQALILLLGFAWTRPAQAIPAVANPAVTLLQPTRFLIEAAAGDPSSPLDPASIHAALALSLTNPDPLAEESIEIEATFTLVRESDAAILPLQTDPAGASLTITTTLVLSAGQRRDVSLPAALRPAEKLDASSPHQVACAFRYRSPDGDWSDPTTAQSVGRSFIHFFNTTPDDPSPNVQGLVRAWTLAQTQILRTAPGRETFAASLDLELFRLDLESAPQEPASIPVDLQLRLIESATGAEIPLAQPIIRITRPLSARSADPNLFPAVEAWTELVHFEPAAGTAIDPLARFVVEVAASIAEPDGAAIPVLPSSLRSTEDQFLVLSGQLRFGSVETTFTQVTNDPLAAMVRNGALFSTELAVSGGSVATAPNRQYGDGTPLSVDYDPVTGHASVRSGRQSLITDDSDIVMLGGLRFVRGVIRLDADGAHLLSSGVILPAGFAVSTRQRSVRHRPALELGEVRLNPDLTLPFAQTQFFPPPGAYFYVFCDRLPLRFRTDAIEWTVANGTFAFRQVPTGDPADPPGPTLTRRFQEEELAALTPLLSDPTAAVRPSNDGYLGSLEPEARVTIGTGPVGEATLTAEFVLGSGAMTSHFPEGVRINWTHGRLRLERNVVVEESYLVSNDPLAIGFRRDCAGDCGPTSGPGQMVFTPENNVLAITADGGLHAAGRVIPERLRWGTTELSNGGSPPEGGFPYAHQTSQWSEGAFHASGGWLAGREVENVSWELRPQALLFSGALNDGRHERPLTTAYQDGFADYPGLNLRVGANSVRGRSVLAGVSTPDYFLKPRSKYYVRAGGVTGIHEAVEIIPSQLNLYGFDVLIDGFRLAFRDGLNVESKTGGSIQVPSPVDPPGFNLDFKELRFECRGQPSKMRLATEGETKSLTYWRTDIVPLSLEFVQPLTGNCPSVSAGFLKVGVETRFPSVTPQKLHAVLGFMANGNLVTRANPLSAGLEIDSRFTLPPNLELVGAGGVPWPVTVAGRAYLNNPTPGKPSPSGSPTPYTPTPADFRRPSQGFLTFPASINVPWFEDVKVQLQVSSSSAANENSAIHLTDGEGWRDGTRTFFTDKFFDSDHLAFPAHLTDASGQRLSIEAYRNQDTPEFNPRARRRWLGVVDFDFPLLWDGTQRRFRSQSQTADLLVLGSVARQIQSLSPSTAEITFGVDLAVPRLNAQSLAAAVKEGISGAVADALSQALSTEVRNALGLGLAQLDALLSERPNDWIAPSVQTAINPVTDALLTGATPDSQLAALQLALRTLPDAGLSQGIQDRLTSGTQAIDAALSLLGTDGSRGPLAGLVRELLKRTGVPGAAELGAEVVNAALAEALPKIEPDLVQAREVLLRIRTALVQAADASSKLAGQVRSVFAATVPSLNLAGQQAVDDLRSEMSQHAWSIASEAERRERIRRRITERVLASESVPKVQYVLRQHVQDRNESLRAALDDVFGQVNHLVREVIRTAVKNGSSELAAVLAESRSPAAGEMGPSSGGSGKLAGINLDGYAQINDESLRVLDINGKFEFNVPDSLKVQAHLRIQEYDANSPPSGCRPAGVAAAVVQIDARAECEWIGAAGTVVEVGAKFSLQDGKPIGFDGYFGLQGEIQLGPVVVSEARLMAGFGGFKSPGGNVNHWAYIGAKVRGRFNAYEAAVGLFFGRTCDAAVIRMIDPDVATVLQKAVGRDSGPMTGVYFFGEAWIPINEVFGIPSTCLFTVRATAGAGFFGFVHDNGATTIGCKQKYGADGRLLCIFGISGEMTIIGALTTAGQPTPTTGASSNNGLFSRADNPDTSAGSFVLFGSGEFAAELGICPFCIELSKSVDLIWTIGGPNAGLDIEF